MSPLDYGIKLNLPCKLWTANMNVLDNKVDIWRLCRRLPLMWCDSQSETDEGEEERRRGAHYFAEFSDGKMKKKRIKMKETYRHHHRLHFSSEYFSFQFHSLASGSTSIVMADCWLFCSDITCSHNFLRRLRHTSIWLPVRTCLYDMSLAKHSVTA